MVTPIEIHFRTDALDDKGKKVVVIEFRGELDESNIDDTAKQVYGIIDKSLKAEKKMPFIFDLSQLNYMNSKSIGYLSDWFNKIKEGGSALMIAGARDNITDILQTVGLDTFIKMTEKVDDAKLTLLGKKPSSKDKK